MFAYLVEVFVYSDVAATKKSIERYKNQVIINSDFIIVLRIACCNRINPLFAILIPCVGDWVRIRLLRQLAINNPPTLLAFLSVLSFVASVT